MPPHKWLFNAEKDNQPLASAVELFKKVLDSLETNASVSLQGDGPKLKIEPKGAVRYVLRYEQHHNNNLGLKMEILWNEDGSMALSHDGEIKVE